MMYSATIKFASGNTRYQTGDLEHITEWAERYGVTILGELVLTTPENVTSVTIEKD